MTADTETADLLDIECRTCRHAVRDHDFSGCMGTRDGNPCNCRHSPEWLAGNQPGPGLLTNEELAVIEALGKIAERVAAIIGDTESEPGAGDFEEAVGALHVVQRMIAANAAARCYPKMIRPLGISLPPV